MTIYYSSTPRGFYFDHMHGDNIPEGAKEITSELHQTLIDGQSQGKIIREDADGYPVLIEPPPLTPEEVAAIERNWRNAKLAATDGDVTRHRDELEEGSATTLSAEQYTALQAYRRQLRDWPQGEEFPLADHRPVAPTWFTE
ncbi:phage tail assembly chaperone [Pseudomonas sp. Pseusp16]|uniref:phage tail assembly chaperone n=1 Tax=Pseudomonas sp. Pseusp16 TaxID=3243021 RepID=UPI0039B67216